MNRHAKSLAGMLTLLALLPLSGCASRPDYALNPPASTEWVTVAVKLPAETEVLPLDVLYRSETCRRKDYDPTTDSHIRTIRGFNPMQIPLSSPAGDGYRKTRIALDGGTKCGWTLSGIRVGIQLAKTSALVQGKDDIAANYVFDFDDEGYSSAFGKGKPKEIRGNLHLATDFFPVITHHLDGKISVKLFGGDTRYEQWSRYYRVSSINQIRIDPVVYLNKIVTITPPNPPPGDLNVTYPDGSTGKAPYIYPDYKKLLLMR
nr:hypothetical protein [uncultured Enterobacter sp.]